MTNKIYTQQRKDRWWVWIWSTTNPRTPYPNPRELTTRDFRTEKEARQYARQLLRQTENAELYE